MKISKGQREDCGLRIADLNKEKNKDSTVGAAFSRDWKNFFDFNDLLFTVHRLPFSKMETKWT